MQKTITRDWAHHWLSKSHPACKTHNIISTHQAAWVLLCINDASLWSELWFDEWKVRREGLRGGARQTLEKKEQVQRGKGINPGSSLALVTRRHPPKMILLWGTHLLWGPSCARYHRQYHTPAMMSKRFSDFKNKVFLILLLHFFYQIDFTLENECHVVDMVT